MRKFFAILAFLFCFIAAQAQTFRVSFKLQDKDTEEPVGFATVSLNPAQGNRAQAKYVLTNHEGKATFEGVRRGNYTLKAELLGYVTFEQAVEISDNVDLGVLKMVQDTETLDAATVSAAGNAVVIKRDTVEYNASSFMVRDDNMLVDLLRKLPGVEVDSDGNITVNGETITKITIDGKTFFLDDPQLASNNIPARIINKVKVVKKKSDQAAFTGIDDGEEETIIDLSVKPGMMQGVFGNAMAGGGHDLPSSPLTFNDGDWRWQGAFMGGRFTDDSQISIILNGNNTNNRGFNDMSGSMMNSMMGGGGGMGLGGGMGGFGRGNNGITTSWMGGVNGTWDLFEGDMDLGANYLYNGTITDVLEESYKETYLDDGSAIISSSDGSSHRFTDGHRFGMRLEHKFSENTSILFQPQVNFGRGSYNQLSVFDTQKRSASGVDSPTNNGFTNSLGDNRNFQTRGFLLLRQRLGIPGRTISANIDWNISNNYLDGFNHSLTNSSFDASGNPTVQDFVNQRIDQLSRSRSAGSRIVYTEPLGGNFYMEGSYNFRWSRSASEKDVFNSGNPYAWTLDPVYMEYVTVGETFDDTYSNSITNTSFTQNIGLAFMYQNEDLRAQLGVSAIPTDTYNVTNGKEYENHVWNFAPRAMLFYDFNENSNVRLFYFGRSSQPSTSQLMPVMDNSNPLSMSLGNPYLTPYFNHGLRSDLEFSNRQSFFTMRLHLEGNYTQNPITSANWYDLNGRQYSFPVNGQDSFNTAARLMVNTPIARSNFSIFNMTRVSYSHSGSYVGASSLDMSGYFNAQDEFDYEKFHTDYFEGGTGKWETDFLDNTTRSFTLIERLRATYRLDNLEIMAGGRTRMTKPWYTVQADVDATWSNQVNASINWTLGDTGIDLGTDLDYNWYRGYTTDQPSEFVWNASASVLVFKRQATLSLKAYDILDQAKNLTVASAENYYSEVRNNTLGRYIILSLTWRFGNFGQAGNQMRQRMGRGGPPGGGRF